MKGWHALLFCMAASFGHVANGQTLAFPIRELRESIHWQLEFEASQRSGGANGSHAKLDELIRAYFEKSRFKSLLLDEGGGVICAYYLFAVDFSWFSREGLQARLASDPKARWWMASSSLLSFSPQTEPY